jgi:Acetyltransferases
MGSPLQINPAIERAVEKPRAVKRPPNHGTIVATVMAGYEGHRGWINYLAVHPDCQRKGYGRMMMNRAEALLLELGCPKINLQVRVGNEGVIEFYRKLGYQIDQVVSLGKRLIHDD